MCLTVTEDTNRNRISGTTGMAYGFKLVKLASFTNNFYGAADGKLKTMNTFFYFSVCLSHFVNASLTTGEKIIIILY